MYILIVYDVGEKRVNKILKICRQYLDWVQNSVLEGELTRATFEELKAKLNKVINEEEDSIRFYKLRTKNALSTEVLGVDKKQIFSDGIV